MTSYTVPSLPTRKSGFTLQLEPVKTMETLLLHNQWLQKKGEGTDLRVARGCHRQEAVPQLLWVALTGKDTQGRAVQERLEILRVLQAGQEVWMIVAKRQGRDLTVDIQQGVAIHIADIVSNALVVVGEEDDAIRELDLVHVGNELLGPGAGDGRADRGAGRLTQLEAGLGRLAPDEFGDVQVFHLIEFPAQRHPAQKRHGQRGCGGDLMRCGSGGSMKSGRDGDGWTDAVDLPFLVELSTRSRVSDGEGQFAP